MRYIYGIDSVSNEARWSPEYIHNTIKTKSIKSINSQLFQLCKGPICVYSLCITLVHSISLGFSGLPYLEQVLWDERREGCLLHKD